MSILNTPKINSAVTAVPSKVRNNVLEVVMMLILVSVGYFYLIKPKQAELDAVKNELSKVEGEKTEAEKTQSALETLKAQLDSSEYATRLSILDESLPLSSRITRTYLEVQQLVTDSAMIPGNIQVDQSVDQAAVNIDLKKVFSKPRKLATLKISLNVIGSMSDFQGLLQTLESQNRVYNIDAVDIQPERENIFAFHVQMKTYVYVPDAVVPNTTAGAINTPTSK